MMMLLDYVAARARRYAFSDTRYDYRICGAQARVYAVHY